MAARIIWFLATITLASTVFLGYSAHRDRHAQSLAMQACEAIPRGASRVQAEAKLNAFGSPVHENADVLTIRFPGAGVDWWNCNLTLLNGKVASHEVNKVD